MITDKLTVFGAKEDVTNICDLTAECAESLGLEPCETVLYTGNVKVFQRGDKALVVLPYMLKEKISSGRVFSYSESESRADITLLNLQKRENTTCFEVLSGTCMSRVFLPHGSRYSYSQVFACISVLCAWGTSVHSAVSEINTILK